MLCLVYPRLVSYCLVGAGTMGVLLPPGPVAAQASDRGPRTTFFFARYATRTSLALYAGYGNNSWQGIVALIENPRTGYREALVGLAKGIAIAQRQRITVALAASDARDGPYGEIYLVPFLSAGRLALSGSAEIAVPLEAQGAFQYYLNPFSLHVELDRRWLVGATYIFAGQVGTATGQALGPSLRLVVPHGSFTLDRVFGLRAYSTETRLSFQTTL